MPSDSQLRHRNMMVGLGHPSGAKIQSSGNPIKLSRTNEERFSPATLLGQDTDDVFSNFLGYSTDEIFELRNKGVIA